MTQSLSRTNSRENRSCWANKISVFNLSSKVPNFEEDRLESKVNSALQTWECKFFGANNGGNLNFPPFLMNTRNGFVVRKLKKSAGISKKPHFTIQPKNNFIFKLVSFLIKMSPDSWPLFPLFCLHQSLFCKKSSTHVVDWIRTSDLQCQERPLYQLSH